MITPLTGTDPRRLLSDSPKIAPPIAAVFNEMRKWEQVSNKRREPFTPAMLTYLHHIILADPTNHHQDSLLSTLSDFFTCGLFAGFRQSEWSQDVTSDPRNPDKNKYGDTAAFTMRDLTFYAPGDIKVTISAALAQPNIPLSAVDTCWRTQKNSENGDKKRFATNTKNPTLCYVTCMRHIARRFVRLRGTKDTTTPLALYVDKQHITKLITAQDISRCMQYLAGAVYHITDPQELRLFSAHSLRVGACVILHATGFTDVQIQFILRWRSLAFMAYLRNLTALSDNQNRAFNQFAMAHKLPPHLIQQP
jgi:hypothetical protein